MKPIKVLAFFLFLDHFTFSQGATGCKELLLISGYRSGDTISVSNLGNLEELLIFNPCTKSFSQRIVSFELTIFGVAGNSHHGFTHELTSKIKEAILKTQPGNKIVIDYALIKKPDGSFSQIAGITLLVGKGPGTQPITIAMTNETPSCSPVVVVGKCHNGDTITKNQLNLVKELKIYNTCNNGKKYNGCSTDIVYKVRSYKVSITRGDSSYSFDAGSPEFPKLVSEKMRDIKEITPIVISEIKASYVDDCFVQVKPVTIYVKPMPLKQNTSKQYNSVRSPAKNSKGVWDKRKK